MNLFVYLPDLALPTGLGQATSPMLLDTPLVHVLQTLVIKIDDDGLGFTLTEGWYCIGDGLFLLITILPTHSLKSVSLSDDTRDLHQLVLVQI